MNIIFFIGTLQQGGAESVVATLTSQLAQRGHRITLVCSQNKQAFHISPEVNIIDVRTWQYDTFKGSFLVRLYKKAANRFKDFNNIRCILKQEEPDIAISFLAVWLWQLIILCKGRIPLVSAERNAMIYPHSRGDFFTKHVLYRLVYAVQVMSRHDKAWLRNRYKRVYAMPNPLRFEPLNKERYDELFPERKNILACGRVQPQKCYENLIKAFSKIKDKFPSWDIDICGATNDEKYYQFLLDVTRDLRVDNRVHFIGAHNDVDVVMQSHSVFCLSSLHEGFPNVLSEALANGMACISFDIVTGPSEIIVDGLDGIIIEDHNIDALADGLSKLLSDYDLRYQLGLRAIEDVKRFNRNKVVDRWENFLCIIKNKYEQGK